MAPAAWTILSQSDTKAWSPVPTTDPMVLKVINIENETKTTESKEYWLGRTKDQSGNHVLD